MSHIDLALRRSQKTGRDASSPFLLTESEGHSIDRVTLETYAPETHSVEQVKPVDVHTPPASPLSGIRKSVRGSVLEFPSWLHGKLVVSRDLNPLSAEQYRRLAASLHGIQSDRHVKTLMVSSAVPNEGKTLTVTNLALTFSESYNRRVLVIDADLRRPAIHDVFSLSNAFGLADAIREGSQNIPLIEVAPRLAVLTAGKVNAGAPTAELASDQLRVLIGHVSAQFDWIFLDTPPAGVFPDARLVARAADGILFVIGSGIAPYDVVQRSLVEFGNKVIGTVLNRVEERSLIAADYYGPGYKSSTRDRLA